MLVNWRLNDPALLVTGMDSSSMLDGRSTFSEDMGGTGGLGWAKVVRGLRLSLSLSLCVNVYVYVCVNVRVHVYVYVCVLMCA